MDRCATLNKRTLYLVLAVLACGGCAEPTSSPSDATLKRVSSAPETNSATEATVTRISSSPDTTNTTPIPPAEANIGQAVIVGAKVREGKLTKAEIETWIQQSRMFSQFSIRETENDNYTGTAFTLDGKTFQLTITQFSTGISCTYDDGHGSSGYMSFGWEPSQSAP